MSNEKLSLGRPKEGQSRAEGRPKRRIPVSGYRDILTVEGKQDGYVYRWVNDVDNRISRFQAAGYDFVQHEVEVGQRTVDNPGKYGSVVSKAMGQGRIGYLMRIPEEFYLEDQAAKQRGITQVEDNMKRTLNSGRDGTYGKVTIGDNE